MAQQIFAWHPAFCHFHCDFGIRTKSLPAQFMTLAGMNFICRSRQGRILNDRRIRVSGRRAMSDCLFATGIPFWDALQKQALVQKR